MHTFGSGLGVCFSKVPVTDPRQYFLIRILRLGEQAPVLQPVHFVSLADIFIIEFSKPPSWMKTEELWGPVKLVEPSRNGPQTTQETVENFSILPQLGHFWLFKAFTNTCTPHYKRLRRVHAEKLPCCWFSQSLHENFDPHTRVTRKGDRIKSNVSCLDWVIHYMFYNGIRVWIRFKDLQWKKKEKPLNHQVKFYYQVSYLNEIPPSLI